MTISTSSLATEKWLGHTSPVSCLDGGDPEDNPHLLLSGSEDCTARLWDLRLSDNDGSMKHRRRACLCIQTTSEIFNVKFASKSNPTTVKMIPNESENSTTGTRTALSSTFAKDHTIFLSMEHVVLEYDLRKATGPIITEPTRDLSGILQNQDEVNQISTMVYNRNSKHSKRKGKKGKASNANKKNNYNNNNNRNSESESEYACCLATADDAGTVRFMESTESEQSQILHHDANAVAVVPTCAFRPGPNKSVELASGGTDCKIHLWDVFRPKHPIASYTIQAANNTESNSSQVCNPPMVHSLAWSTNGSLLAAGLGDGNIPIFSVNNRSLVQAGFLPDGHASSVASVVFPKFDRQNERLVISGGSDGSILCWDVGSNVMEMGETRASINDLFMDGFLNMENSSDYAVDQVAQQTQNLNIGQPKVLFEIAHQRKVNWITTSMSSIFVADTSNDITEYKIPLR